MGFEFHLVGWTVEDFKNWFTQTDWAELGAIWCRVLSTGIMRLGRALLDVLCCQVAIYLAASLLGIKSPFYAFFEIGVNIGQGLIAGIQSMVADVMGTLESLFETMGNVVGQALGSAASFSVESLTRWRPGSTASPTRSAATTSPSPTWWSSSAMRPGSRIGQTRF